MYLVARLRPDPLGQLIASRISPSWFGGLLLREEKMKKGREKERTEREGEGMAERKKEGREGVLFLPYSKSFHGP